MEVKVSKNNILLKSGEIIKKNDFETNRGFYTIRIIKHEGKLYFHKMKNGETVEIVTLN